MTRALIFDFDGLIVDTETAIYQAWAELYQKFDQELLLADYAQCVGSDFHTYDPQAALEVRHGQPIIWDDVLPEKDERIRELLLAQDTRPGVRQLIEQAGAAGVDRAVASSSTFSWVGGWLRKLGIDHHFPVIRCRDHVEKIKPSPDLFLAAAEKLGVAPHEALVLEDSVNGLKAAKAAGIPCVIVHNPVTSAGDFSGAAKIFDSFEGLTLDLLL
jgi:putative hydrolase of the HAD superfamily